MIGGVCAGLADYWSTDKTWVRLAFLIAFFFGFTGIGLFGPVAYVILWIAIPADRYRMDYQGSSADQEAMEEQPRSSNDRRTFGIILLIIGAFLLFLQFGFFNWADLYLYWPALLIVLGLFHVATAFGKPAGGGSGPGAQDERNNNL